MKQQVIFEEPRQALPGEEPSNTQVVNAIVWAIDKLGGRIVGFIEGMERRAERIEERIARIEESVAVLHEEKGRTAQPEKDEAA